MNTNTPGLKSVTNHLMRFFVMPSLLIAGFFPTSTDAGFISVTATQGGSAASGATYSTLDDSILGTINQNINTNLAVKLSGTAAFVHGGLSGQYARPIFSGANNQYFYPNSSTSNPPANGSDTTNYLATGTGSITFSNNAGGTLGTYFGLLWGSVDTFNSLIFNFADGSASVTLSGSGLTGVSTNTSTTYYVNITSSTAISSVVATSSSNSFEIDNIAFGSSAVPEPASLTMIGFGLTVVGLAARKRRSLSLSEFRASRSDGAVHREDSGLRGTN